MENDVFRERTDDEKFQTVLDKNTFFYFNDEFEEKYDSETLSVLSNLLYNVQSKVIQQGTPTKEIFDELLVQQYGLRALLALNGFSNEMLKRVITVARIVNDADLNRLLLRDQWSVTETTAGITEWSTDKIEALIRTDRAFRAGIVNLFFEGASNRLLTRVLAPFHVRKLTIRKLSFEIEPMIDTLVRYKESGSYSGKSANNPEQSVRELLSNLGVSYDQGDLQHLVSEAYAEKRTMDFIIPDKTSPLIIAESSFLKTTSSAQGDKSKTEGNIRKLLKRHYPQAKFVGFVDGIGWYVRQGDLKRMVAAFDEVFTFHPDELLRFAVYVGKVGIK